MSRSSALRALQSIAITSLISGCMLVRIDSPMEELHEVSLLPVIAESINKSQSWTDSFRKNLLRVEGIDRVVLTEYPVTDGQPMPASYSQDELPIAETSQALVEIKLLTFDPYYPPSASLEVNLYVPSGIQKKDDPGMSLDRQGQMPLRGFGRIAKHKMTFQLVYRADDPKTNFELKKYAWAQSDDDRGMTSVDRIVRSSDRFIDFVAFETIEESCARLAALRDGEDP